MTPSLMDLVPLASLLSLVQPLLAVAWVTISLYLVVIACANIVDMVFGHPYGYSMKKFHSAFGQEKKPMMKRRYYRNRRK